MEERHPSFSRRGYDSMRRPQFLTWTRWHESTRKVCKRRLSTCDLNLNYPSGERYRLPATLVPRRFAQSPDILFILLPAVLVPACDFALCGLFPGQVFTSRGAGWVALRACSVPAIRLLVGAAVESIFMTIPLMNCWLDHSFCRAEVPFGSEHRRFQFSASAQTCAPDCLRRFEASATTASDHRSRSVPTTPAAAHLR
jgi:hypothetical protein